ncbi:cell surface glycoprotein 2 precursor [Lysinibacillus fusiformis ZC1]|uniref:S-layer homology domain-containing protein n=1 Tax=Lysinibacillus capsici TaxID=2115968 RepID=UPI0001DA4A89|nr:cell surface glycoprotein 2 precursor [Lysinibacillus fusiformis ZC1]
MIFIQHSKRKILNLIMIFTLVACLLPLSSVAAKSSLTSFNTATNTEEMKLAMTTDWSVLHYTAKANELFQSFKLADQNYLANKLIDERPQSGYTSTSTLRQTYLNAVNNRSYLININSTTDSLTLWTVFIDDDHLNYNNYNLLTIEDQDEVCKQILLARPNQGYESIETLQSVLDSKVSSILVQKVQLDKETLNIQYAQGDTSANVTKNLTLPIIGDNGTTINWISDKPEVVQNNGSVVRPTISTGNQKVTLTAQIFIGNFVDTKSFTIDVMALSKSHNAFLKDLTISQGALNMAFNKNTMSYTAIVTSRVDSIFVNPLAEDKKAEITINGRSVEEPIKLVTGVNTIKILVTAEDGSQKLYTIVVTKENTSTNSENTSTLESSPPSSTESFTVNVESSNGKAVSKTTIKRLVDVDGLVKDEVILTEASVLETINKLKEEKSDQARIVIPNSQDNVKQVDISIPNNIVTLLKESRLNLEISAYDVSVNVSNESLATFSDNLYFRLIPLKGQAEQSQVEERAKKESIVQEIANSSFSKVLGQPMKIETNMQNRPVLLTLPLPTDITQEQLNHLAIYIEHSDGTKEVVRGKVVEYQKGITGLQFEVNKFSTFSILYLPEKEEVKEPTTEGVTHLPYIQGYPDGTFRPNAPVTRAQMASMFARQLTGNAIPQAKATYTDTFQHDAKDAIEFAKEKGLFKGVTATNFNPNGLITRAQIATVAARWIEQQCVERPDADFCPSTSQSPAFKDVSVHHWAVKAIDTVNAAEIMTGITADTFNPDGFLTRAQAVKVLNRLFERQVFSEDQIPLFKDVPKHHWAFYEIQEAAKK